MPLSILGISWSFISSIYCMYMCVYMCIYIYIYILYINNNNITSIGLGTVLKVWIWHRYRKKKKTIPNPIYDMRIVLLK